MIEVFKNALLRMDREQVEEVLRTQAQSPVALLEAVMVPALEEIGKEWEEGSTSLSQAYMSGRICEELIERLRSVSAYPLPATGLKAGQGACAAPRV